MKYLFLSCMKDPRNITGKFLIEKELCSLLPLSTDEVGHTYDIPSNALKWWSYSRDNVGNIDRTVRTHNVPGIVKFKKYYAKIIKFSLNCRILNLWRLNLKIRFKFVIRSLDWNIWFDQCIWIFDLIIGLEYLIWSVYWNIWFDHWIEIFDLIIGLEYLIWSLDLNIWFDHWIGIFDLNIWFEYLTILEDDMTRKS